MFQRILVPLDGSERAEQAIPVAARLARATQGELLLVRVVHVPCGIGIYGAEPSVEPTAFEKHLAEASSYLRTVMESYTQELEGLYVLADVESGGVSSAIFTAARLEHVDLIVMCHHEATGLARWIFKRVAERAVRHSPVPVLVLNVHGTLPPVSDPLHVWRALVPLDGSELAECALEPAAQLMAALAAPLRAELHLLSVVKSSCVNASNDASLPVERPEQVRKDADLYLERVTQRIRQGPLASLPLNFTASTVINSDVPATILRHANQIPGTQASNDVIAIATHGRSGVQRLLMGSVTQYLLGTTTLPLLVVRPTEAEVPVAPSAFA